MLDKKYEELFERLFALAKHHKDSTLGCVRLVQHVLALNDIATDTFLKMRGLDFLQNLVFPSWPVTGYKAVAAVCAKPRFIDEVLKTTLIKDLIQRIVAVPPQARPEDRKSEELHQEEEKKAKPSEDSDSEEGKGKKKAKVKANTKEKTGGAAMKSCVKYFERIVKKSKPAQIAKLVEFGALEALAKHLVQTDPALENVYETLEFVLDEGRNIEGERPNVVSVRADSIGLRRKIIECTRAVLPPGQIQ